MNATLPCALLNRKRSILEYFRELNLYLLSIYAVQPHFLAELFGCNLSVRNLA